MSKNTRRIRDGLCLILEGKLHPLFPFSRFWSRSPSVYLSSIDFLILFVSVLCLILWNVCLVFELSQRLPNFAIPPSFQPTHNPSPISSRKVYSLLLSFFLLASLRSWWDVYYVYCCWGSRQRSEIPGTLPGSCPGPVLYVNFRYQTGESYGGGWRVAGMPMPEAARGYHKLE